MTKITKTGYLTSRRLHLVRGYDMPVLVKVLKLTCLSFSFIYYIFSEPSSKYQKPTLSFS